MWLLSWFGWGLRRGACLLYVDNSSLFRRRNFLLGSVSGRKSVAPRMSKGGGEGTDWIRRSWDIRARGSYLRMSNSSLFARDLAAEKASNGFSQCSSDHLQPVLEGKAFAKWSCVSTSTIVRDVGILSRDTRHRKSRFASPSPDWYNPACVRFSECKTCSVRHDIDQLLYISQSEGPTQEID